MKTHPPKDVIDILHQGGVIAYPTEAVFGLGCDPENEAAVMRLLQLKQRSIAKGLILIAATWEQVSPYAKPLPEEMLQSALSVSGVTWVFPAASHAPPWITGQYDSIALRVSAHPVVRELCQLFGKPLVSTSANREGLPPARSVQEVMVTLGDHLDAVVVGELGGRLKPTEIRDILTGQVLRPGI